MRQVELAPGIHSSVLGFGCAPILGSVDARTAKRALTEALDLGVTHFDVARSYGYGQAEAFVGKFLSSRRHEVTLVTKFGITASPLAAMCAPLKPLVRGMRGLAKGKRVGSADHSDGVTTQTESIPQQGAAPRLAKLLHRRIPITPANLSKSVDVSLRSLRSDYIDVLLVHEPLTSISQIDAILGYAELLISYGKIRAFGLSYMQSHELLHAEYLERCGILQTNVPQTKSGYEQLVRSEARKPNIFFSPFRGLSGAHKPTSFLRKMGGDFPDSVIVCSMFKPEHIKANASAFCQSC